MNALALERRDAAGGLNVERKIQCQRAGMKQIERPEVEGASGQIGAAGRLGDDRRCRLYERRVFAMQCKQGAAKHAPLPHYMSGRRNAYWEERFSARLIVPRSFWIFSCSSVMA